jgi:DnaJ-class molecular chaperone
MKDYYKTLGVPRNASPDEIKKAYRSKAMKHHPDRGGDEKVFKEINEAHDILSDPQKKSMLDQGVDPLNPQQGGGFGNHEFHFTTGGMDDILRGFGFNFGFGQGTGFQQRQQPRNKSLNVNLTISLEEAFMGVEKTIEIQYPTGRKQMNITIPKGVDNGMAIRYSGMGDDSIKNLPAGDLTISINVMPHPKFAREGLNLLTDSNIDCFDAILGTTVDIRTLDGRVLQLVVPPGTQSGTTLGLRNEGMTDQAGNIGRLYVRVNVQIPTDLDPNAINLIKHIKGIK